MLPTEAGPIWALLAAFLLRRPAWMRAVVLGGCAGLFVAAQAYPREPLLGSPMLLAVTVAGLAGGAFHLALRAEARRQPAAGDAPPWVHVSYAVAWLGAIGAAVDALVGVGGIRTLLQRRPAVAEPSAFLPPG